jgi:hypothetical protein
MNKSPSQLDNSHGQPFTTRLYVDRNTGDLVEVEVSGDVGRVADPLPIAAERDPNLPRSPGDQEGIIAAVSAPKYRHLTRELVASMEQTLTRLMRARPPKPPEMVHQAIMMFYHCRDSLAEFEQKQKNQQNPT